MWRRMHSKAYFSYNCGVNANVDESHPFIPLNTGGGGNGGGAGNGGNASGGNGSNGQVRQGGQVSATRQFNESPSFQRLTNPVINNIQSNTSFNSLSRHRFGNGTATLSHQNNNSSNYSSSMNNTSNNNPYITATMGRGNHDEYSINTDPYLMYKRMPTAPPSLLQQQHHNNNYMSTNYETNESCLDAHISAQNSIK